MDILVASSTQNPCPKTGCSVKEQVLETLVSIITRKYPQLLIKSGLQCLDHLLTKQAIQLGDIARKFREMEPSLLDSPDLLLWRSFNSYLFSWMELSYVGPLAGKGIVHVFRGLQNQELDHPSPDSTGFTVENWVGWLRDGLDRNPDILEDIKNYVLVPIFKTDKPSALILLQTFNRAESLTASEQQLTDQAFMLQLATLELGKRYGLVEEPSKSVKSLFPGRG